MSRKYIQKQPSWLLAFYTTVNAAESCDEVTENGESLAEELGGGSLLRGMNPQIVTVVYASIYRRVYRDGIAKKIGTMFFPTTNADIARGSYTVTCLVKGCPEGSFAQICKDLRAFTCGQEQCWSDLNIAQDKFSHSGLSRATKLIYIHTKPSVIRETGITETAQVKIQRLRQYVECELNPRYECAMSVNEVTKNHTERFALLFTHDTYVEKNMVSAAFGPFLSLAEQEEENRGTTRSFISMLNESKTFVNFNSFRQVKAVMAACKRNELFLGHSAISLHDIVLVQNSEKMQHFENFLEEEGYSSARKELPLSVIEEFVTSIFANQKHNKTQKLNTTVMLRSYLSDELGYQFDSERDVYYTGRAATMLPVKAGFGTRFNGNVDCAPSLLVPNQGNHSVKPPSASPVRMYVHVPWYGRECPKMHMQLSELEKSTFQRTQPDDVDIHERISLLEKAMNLHGQNWNIPTPMRMKMLKMWCGYNENCNNPF